MIFFIGFPRTKGDAFISLLTNRKSVYKIGMKEIWHFCLTNYTNYKLISLVLWAAYNNADKLAQLIMFMQNYTIWKTI